MKVKQHDSRVSDKIDKQIYKDNKIITQFFFDHEKFLRFRDKSIALGIKAPIIPGILPIDNFKKVKDFSLKCGTIIPKWIEDKFSNLKEEEKNVK